MQYSLKYGHDRLTLTLPAAMTPTVIRPAERPALADPLAACAQALAQPIGTPALVAMLRARKPKRVVIVVNDITRPTPYPVMLPPLLTALEQADIPDAAVTFLIATGIHAPHTEAQNRQIYGDALVSRFAFVNHDAFAANALSYMGDVASGYPLYVNTLAKEADFLITLGVVMPHYFAGYSGGRKSILPGLAGHLTVEKNHARMVELMDALPPIDHNPVSLEMLEAARRVGVDFVLNAIMNDRGEVVTLTAGDLEASWRQAVTVSAAMFEVPFDRPADVCITCAGGFPRDINAYQAQKALDHADRITRAGATIILAARCEEGYGEPVFQEWMQRGWEPERIMRELKQHFVMGGHKAYGFAKVAAQKHCLLLSDFSPVDSACLFARKVPSLQAAVDAALARHGAAAHWVVMPEGGVSLPVPRV